MCLFLMLIFLLNIEFLMGSNFFLASWKCYIIYHLVFMTSAQTSETVLTIAAYEILFFLSCSFIIIILSAVFKTLFLCTWKWFVKLMYLFTILVFVHAQCVSRWASHGKCAEVRGWLCGVTSLCLPLGRFQGLDSGCQACSINASSLKSTFSIAQDTFYFIILYYKNVLKFKNLWIMWVNSFH